MQVNVCSQEGLAPGSSCMKRSNYKESDTIIRIMRKTYDSLTPVT